MDVLYVFKFPNTDVMWVDTIFKQLNSNFLSAVWFPANSWGV